MSVHTAELGDVYRDKDGRLWIVRSYCEQPTVTMERLFPAGEDPLCAKGEYVKGGGVSGLMWQGFVKLTPAKPTTGE